MTPDSQEGRERITRLESRVEDIKADVDRNERTFGPLPLAVERLQWTIDAINARLDKRDAADDERFERLTRSFENQITTCSHEVAKVADAQQKWQEAERERREIEREKREAREREAAKLAATTKTERFIAKYGLVGVLGAALIAAGASILNTFIG